MKEKKNFEFFFQRRPQMMYNDAQWCFSFKNFFYGVDVDKKPQKLAFFAFFPIPALLQISIFTICVHYPSSPTFQSPKGGFSLPLVYPI